ncbi:hypothetical protein C8R43DRAFT_947144 [Mycena crocata]|nr:hypothetical protein C8R43DRAFT_947144 [Mycena crocata]
MYNTAQAGCIPRLKRCRTHVTPLRLHQQLRAYLHNVRHSSQLETLLSVDTDMSILEDVGGQRRGQATAHSVSRTKADSGSREEVPAPEREGRYNIFQSLHLRPLLEPHSIKQQKDFKKLTSARYPDYLTVDLHEPGHSWEQLGQARHTETPNIVDPHAKRSGQWGRTSEKTKYKEFRNENRWVPGEPVNRQEIHVAQFHDTVGVGEGRKSERATEQ